MQGLEDEENAELGTKRNHALKDMLRQIFIEDEGRRIGNVSLPPVLSNRMKENDGIVLETVFNTNGMCQGNRDSH